MNTLIIGLLIYLVVFPIIFRLIGFMDSSIKKRRLQKQLMTKGASKANILKNAPEPSWPKWSGRLKFTRGDKRQFVLGKPKEGKQPKTLPLSRRQAYWGIRLLGLVFALLGGFLGLGKAFFVLLVVAFIFYWISIFYGYFSANGLMTAREQLIKKMFSVARAKLNQSSEYEANPQQVVRVVEWRDMIKPEKIEFDIPDTFGEEGIEGFMKLFNQNFGRETAFVAADNEETGDPGWDFDKGVATIKAVPPLPRLAKWDEHYVINEAVAWSFFPIALGVEHGVELPNPQTGEAENVLGFDLSGEQAKLGAKMGIKVAPTITTSPMVLVGGTTGGGKSLSVDTLVEVLDSEEQDLGQA